MVEYAYSLIMRYPTWSAWQVSSHPEQSHDGIGLWSPPLKEVTCHVSGTRWRGSPPCSTAYLARWSRCSQFARPRYCLRCADISGMSHRNLLSLMIIRYSPATSLASSNGVVLPEALCPERVEVNVPNLLGHAAVSVVQTSAEPLVALTAEPAFE